MIQAVIFDMDGVLIDSEPLHCKAEIHALGAFGLSIAMEDIKPYVGANRDAFRDGLTKKFGVPLDWDAVFAKKDELFYTLIEDVKSIPGALPFVQALKEGGFKLGMATSSQERLVQLIVQKFNLEPLFDTVVCTIDITHSKPHPEIFLKAADRLHIDPTACAVVEDSINGVKAAKAAGMYTIGLTTSFTRPQLSNADCIIDSFAELNVEKIQSLTTGAVEEPLDCVDVC